MTNPASLSLTLKIILAIVAGFLIVYGSVIILKWSYTPYSNKDSYERPYVDSSFIKKQTKDSSSTKTLTTTESTLYRTFGQSQCSTCEVTLVENMRKGGYDLVLLGLMLLLLLLILPDISTINILSVFSATFREKIETAKAIINNSVNAVNTNITPNSPDITNEPVNESQIENYKKILPTASLEVETFKKYSSDPQKNQWGGREECNDRKIVASVIPLPGQTELFKVIIKVISTNIQKPLKDKVIFHLHPTFPNPDPVIYVLQGEARLELIAWGAFTLGAETDNATKLELDLANLPDAPVLFKSR